MAESITNPEQERQAELLRQRQKEEQEAEKQRRADFEKWEARRKELSEEFEKNTRKEWERQAYNRLMAEARGLNFRPPGMAALGNHATTEQVMDYARAEVDRKKFEWLKAEQKKFLEALKEERDKQAALAKERAEADQQRKAKALEAPKLPPRSSRPDRGAGSSRYAELRQLESQDTPPRKQAGGRDAELAERIERNRALLREELEKERQGGPERERDRGR